MPSSIVVVVPSASAVPGLETPAVRAVVSFLAVSLSRLESAFNSIPGSAVLLRYIRNSHQNDPWRTLLEIALFAFAVRTVLSSRTRTDRSGKNFVQLTEKEIDELVADWTPEPLCADVLPESLDASVLSSLPVIAGPTGPKVRLTANPSKSVINLASYNFTGLAEHEKLKDVALETLKVYGVGSCGPPGFYGTIDVHQALEANISKFLGTQSTIIYAQAFACISSVIPSFSKRGDIIIADRLCNFGIQRGLQISRSTVIWYEHGDMSSLEQALERVARDAKRKGGKLSRRFVITEGLFETDGFIPDLERIIELKKKYKARLILDESLSFGVLGATGRGLTELYGVPATDVDMIVGSMATGLNAGGGFCSGSLVVTEHQRINSASFVYSAALPAMLATTASAGMNILETHPEIFTTLAENVRILRASLDKLCEPPNASSAPLIVIPSDPSSPLVHVQLGLPDPVDLAGIEAQERLLQEVVDEALATGGVLLTRARRLRGQEAFEARPSLKISVSASLSKKEMEKSASAVKAALVKVLGHKKR